MTDYKNFTKCQIFDNVYFNGDIKVTDRCHITGNYRGSAHKDCNTKFKLIHKIPSVFHNVRQYDSHLIMQALGKFSFEINIIPNRLEKYMSFNISNKLVFIDSFQFLSSQLDSLVRNLGKDNLKYLSQEFNSNILDLVKKGKRDFILMII